MKYSKLVETYQKLEKTQSTLEKTSILAELFSESEENIEEVVLLAMGRPFPKWKDLDLGISSRTMVDIISQATGKSESEVEKAWKEEGDLGIVAEKMVEGKTQQRLMTQELTAEKVLERTDKVARMGENSLESVNMDKKKKHIAELISSASPIEARYITRTVLQNMRLGVGEGTVRDALAEAFFQGENTEEIQRAYDLTTDFSTVAKACTEDVGRLKNLEVEIFRPIRSMLAKKVESVEEGFDTVGKPAAIDYKYDGMRAQIHKKDDEVKVFTRRLEEVTKQFPDVVKAVKTNLEADKAIIDTEIVAYNPEDYSKVPFQKLSKRIKRKYEIQRLKEQIPVEVRPFDILYLDNSLLNEDYRIRWEKLVEVVQESDKEFKLVDRAVTESEDEVVSMQQKSLSEGHEGIMMKALDARYKPGSRVGYMVKLKPVMETLDLAIVGGEWGEGRRKGWIGSFKLGCYSPEKDEYLEVGKMATGLTDEQLEELTKRLKPLIIDEDGRDIDIKPEVMVEAEYEEIQKSPNYSSGYALRFPRLKSFRDDKDVPDSVQKVRDLFNQQ